MPFVFDPSDGFRNTTSFPSRPANEALYRDDFQKLHDQTRDYINNLESGWTPINEVWTYASANTINVPSGAVLRYKIGDKITLEQSVQKFFVIVGVADTLLTVTGGNNFSVANASINGPQFSRQENPRNWPDVFDWSPSYMGFSAAPSGGDHRFSIKGRTVLINVRPVTTGTSNSISFTISLPVSASRAAYIICRAFNGAATQYGLVSISPGSNVATLTVNLDGGSWASSGNKMAQFQGFYEI
jgi:hypothetical protein